MTSYYNKNSSYIEFYTNDKIVNDNRFFTDKKFDEEKFNREFDKEVIEQQIVAKQIEDDKLKEINNFYLNQELEERKKLENNKKELVNMSIKDILSDWSESFSFPFKFNSNTIFYIGITIILFAYFLNIFTKPNRIYKDILNHT